MGYYEAKFVGYEDAPADIDRERPRFKIDPANRGKYLLAKLRAF
jgi:hypothetical protein